MIKLNRAVALLLLMGSIHTTADAQIWKFGKKKAKSESTEKSDSLKSSKAEYDKLLKDAVTDEGFFNVHRVKTDYYFEIPDSVLGRDMLIVNKISGVPAEINAQGVNKGMGIGEQVVRFYKDTLNKKVWVSTRDPRIVSPENDSITVSVRDNYRESVIEFFDIKAYSEDSTSVVVKANKIFDGNSKSFNNSFGSIGLSISPITDLSKIESIKSFPQNIKVRALHSAKYSDGISSTPLSIDVTTNIVLLSKEPMRARFLDERIGFFKVDRAVFNDEQHEVEKRELVTRWKLEPKAEDVEKYLAGELVEPKKPIIFYIDPSTPPKWVPYILTGVEEWNVAFQEAGFKNAIQARTVDPVRDADFDVDDIRYSVVTYAASQIANAMGPSVVDPRSGEIIEADIIWWHNVMSLLHSWVRLQTGAVDESVRGNKLPDHVMGNAVRFVSSHEVGHSLGLKHNMGSSYSVPVDSLRSKTYTDEFGTASSIMDYARFNYVAQPEDGITNLIPRIGTYDKYAIDWAYRWLDVKDSYEELPTLNEWIREHENDLSYWYGEQSAEGIDPRSQTEDLGDDAVVASQYGLKNLKRIVPHIVEWTEASGELQLEAGHFLWDVISQWERYSDHVMMNVGGFYLENVVGGRDLDRYTPVPAAMQQKSVDYLIDEVFTYPEWLFGSDVWKHSYASLTTPVGHMEYSPYNVLRNYQYGVYYRLLSEERMLRMYESVPMDEIVNFYSPEKMMAQITKAVFRDPRGSLTLAQRMSQKNYVDALIVSMNKVMLKTTLKGNDLHAHDHDCSINGCSLMRTAPAKEMIELPRPEEIYNEIRTLRNYSLMQRVSEATSAKRAELDNIRKIAKANQNSGDAPTRNHYKDLILRIDEALNH